MNTSKPNADRPRFSSTVYLFHEGRTELKYFQDISQESSVHIIHRERDAAPVKLLEKAFRFVKKDGRFILRTTPDPHVWVLFDDDEKPDIRDAADWFDRNRLSIPLPFRERFHVGYMKPCIELWGMLCHPKGRTAFRRAHTHTAMQHELHRVMPSYDHDANPYFDAGSMTETAFACKTAENWERSSGSFPACCGTSYFAGIHSLVRILTSR